MTINKYTRLIIRNEHKMDRIYDYIIIISYGILSLIVNPLDLDFIIGFLLAIIFTSLFYLYDKKRILYVFILSFLLLLLFGFNIVTFTPLVIYVAMNKKYSIIISIITILITIYSTNNADKSIYFFLLFGYLLAYYLSYRSNKYNILAKEYLKTRDDIIEKNLFLTKKYNSLKNSQNNEIYTATLQERNRIAREIHDNVGHMISRAILMIGALKSINKDDTINTQLNGLDDTLSETMDSIRTSIHKFHDDSIDLENSINNILQNTYSISFHLDYDVPHNIPREIKYCFITIVKEAISNTVRHSNSDTVNITIREHPKLYQLIINDNGSEEPYFLKNILSLPNNGIGLENMSERVKSLNGNIQFSYNKGFKIFITIP